MPVVSSTIRSPRARNISTDGHYRSPFTLTARSKLIFQVQEAVTNVWPRCRPHALAEQPVVIADSWTHYVACSARRSYIPNAKDADNELDREPEYAAYHTDYDATNLRCIPCHFPRSPVDSRTHMSYCRPAGCVSSIVGTAPHLLCAIYAQGGFLAGPTPPSSPKWDMLNISDGLLGRVPSAGAINLDI